MVVRCFVERVVIIGIFGKIWCNESMVLMFFFVVMIFCM